VVALAGFDFFLHTSQEIGWEDKLQNVFSGMLYLYWTYSYYYYYYYYYYNLGKPAPEKQNHSGKTKLDLLEQEIVSSGISWAIWKSASHSRQITTTAPHTQFFTGQMPFLPPYQQVFLSGDKPRLA